MKRKFPKIIYILVCFLLIFQQSGFAQVAGELNIAGHLNAMHNTLFAEKFRPLHLRYLSYDSLNNNFKLLLDKGDQFPDSRGHFPSKLSGDSSKESVPWDNAKLQDETKTLLNYFFIGISLPNDSFWVNLRPDSPDNIIDPLLAQTDLGKILLEADLQLKKDTANFTSPQTPEGKAYWDKLYRKAGELFGTENITIPTLTRPWIVPNEIIIRESTDNAYIYKATLKVMLEQDYLKDSSVYSFTDERLKQLNEYSSQLIRATIIPKLTKDINTAKRYAPLRQVYYSLILSQWFKQKFYGRDGLYSHLINKSNLTGLGSKEPWSKTTYFQAYQKSFKEGEYNIKEQAYYLGAQTLRNYMSGGIALGAGEVQKASSAIVSNRAELPQIKYASSAITTTPGTMENPFGLEIQWLSSPIISPAVGSSPVSEQEGASRRDFLKAMLEGALAGAVVFAQANPLLAFMFSEKITLGGENRVYVELGPGETLIEAIKVIVDNWETGGINKSEYLKLKDELIEGIKSANPRAKELPGQKFDIQPAFNILSAAEIRLKSKIIAEQNMPGQGRGKGLKVYYLDEQGEESKKYRTFIIGDSVFFSLKGLRQDIEVTIKEDEWVKAKFPSSGKITEEIFAGMSYEEIGDFMLREYYLHELTHPYTSNNMSEGRIGMLANKIVNDAGVPAEIRFRVKQELAAYLSEIAGSDKPKYIMRLLSFVSALFAQAGNRLESGIGYGPEYVYVSAIITKLMFEKLGYLNYYINDEKRDIRNKAATGAPWKLENYDAMSAFMLSLPDASIKEEARKFFEGFFGQLPVSNKLYSVPKEVRDYLRESAGSLEKVKVASSSPVSEQVMDRRGFLKTVAGLAGAVVLSSTAAEALELAAARAKPKQSPAKIIKQPEPKDKIKNSYEIPADSQYIADLRTGIYKNLELNQLEELQRRSLIGDSLSDDALVKYIGYSNNKNSLDCVEQAYALLNKAGLYSSEQKRYRVLFFPGLKINSGQAIVLEDLNLIVIGRDIFQWLEPDILRKWLAIKILQEVTRANYKGKMFLGHEIKVHEDTLSAMKTLGGIPLECVEVEARLLHTFKSIAKNKDNAESVQYALVTNSLAGVKYDEEIKITVPKDPRDSQELRDRKVGITVITLTAGYKKLTFGVTSEGAVGLVTEEWLKNVKTMGLFNIQRDFLVALSKGLPDASLGLNSDDSTSASSAVEGDSNYVKDVASASKVKDILNGLNSSDEISKEKAIKWVLDWMAHDTGSLGYSDMEYILNGAQYYYDAERDLSVIYIDDVKWDEKFKGAAGETIRLGTKFTRVGIIQLVVLLPKRTRDSQDPWTRLAKLHEFRHVDYQGSMDVEYFDGPDFEAQLIDEINAYYLSYFDLYQEYHSKEPGLAFEKFSTEMASWNDYWYQMLRGLYSKIPSSISEAKELKEKIVRVVNLIINGGLGHSGLEITNHLKNARKLDDLLKLDVANNVPHADSSSVASSAVEEVRNTIILTGLKQQPDDRYSKEASANLVTFLKALGVPEESVILNIGYGANPLSGRDEQGVAVYRVINVDTQTYFGIKEGEFEIWKKDFFEITPDSLKELGLQKKPDVILFYNMRTYMDIYGPHKMHSSVLANDPLSNVVEYFSKASELASPTGHILLVNFMPPELQGPRVIAGIEKRLKDKKTTIFKTGDSDDSEVAVAFSPEAEIQPASSAVKGKSALLENIRKNLEGMVLPDPYNKEEKYALATEPVTLGKPVIETYLRRATDGKLSRAPILKVALNQEELSFEIFLDRILFESRGKPSDLSNNGFGPDILSRVGEVVPPGTRLKIYVVNEKTIKRMLEDKDLDLDRFKGTPIETLLSSMGFGKFALGDIDIEGGKVVGFTLRAVKVQPTYSAVKDVKGGIDFRSLPAVVQPMPVFRGQSPTGTVPVIPLVELNKEWEQIENMLNAGITPSSDRLKVYLQSCCQKQDFNQDIDKVLSCIADIFRLEEEKAAGTEVSLKQMLTLLESDRPVSEMQVALAQITVEAKAPR